MGLGSIPRLAGPPGGQGRTWLRGPVGTKRGRTCAPARSLDREHLPLMPALPCSLSLQLVPQRSNSVTLECTSPPDTFLQSMLDFEEFVPPVPPPPYYPPEYTCSSETDAQRYPAGSKAAVVGPARFSAGAGGGVCHRTVPPEVAFLLLPLQHHLQWLHGQPCASLPNRLSPLLRDCDGAARGQPGGSRRAMGRAWLRSCPARALTALPCRPRCLTRS